MKIDSNKLYRAFSIADMFNPDHNDNFSTLYDKKQLETKTQYISRLDMLPETRRFKYLYNEQTGVVTENRDVSSSEELDTLFTSMLVIRDLLGLRGTKTLFDGFENPDTPTPNDVYAYICYLFISVPFESFFDTMNSYGSLFDHEGVFNFSAYSTIREEVPALYSISAEDAINRFNLTLNFLAYKLYYAMKIDSDPDYAFINENLVIIGLLDAFPDFVEGVAQRRSGDKENCYSAYLGFAGVLGREAGLDFVRYAIRPSIEIEAPRPQAMNMVCVDNLFSGCENFPDVLKVLIKGIQVAGDR